MAVWLTGLLAVVTLVHVFLLVAPLRTSRPHQSVTDGGHASDGQGRSAAAGDAVACPDCDEENRPEYRFCRRFVTELPGDDVCDYLPGVGASRRTL